MVTNSYFVASALTAGTIAQTTSVMDLFIDSSGTEGYGLQGSVISAAPDATTYSVTWLPATDCSVVLTYSEMCGAGPGMTYVNGPSTFARHYTEVDALTWDVDCKLDGEYADCATTLAGPSANNPGFGTGVLVGLTDSLTPVTITAGLEKILAASTVTGAASTATSGTAQTAASASSGPSETGASASETSASSSASSPSTTASGAATGVGRNVVLAGVCGVVALVMGL